MRNIPETITDQRHINKVCVSWCRLDLVESFVCDSELRQTCQDDLLRRFPDLHRMAKKFHRHSATMQDCYRVYQAVSHLPALISALERYSGSEDTTLCTVKCSICT